MSFWYTPPKEINPDTIYDMMSSEGTQTMFDRSEDLLDPNSALNVAAFNKLNQVGQNNLYTQNRMNRMNMNKSGLSDQSGVMNAIGVENALKNSGTVYDSFNELMMQNLGASNQLLGQATQTDMQARDAMSSAYGQNITNMNKLKPRKISNG